MKKGEIVFCDLHLKTKKGKKIVLNEVVFSHPYNHIKTELKVGNYDDVRTIHKTGLDEDLIIEKVEVIKSLGFKHKGNKYTEVKKNDNNNRNKITGAYD